MNSIVRRFGQQGGSPVLYLHGAPGAPVEAELIASVAAARGIELWAIDRAKLVPGAQGAKYLDRLAHLVVELGAGRRLPILGFSIGAALALRVAARLGADSGPLLLCSAAGPLDLPGAFDGMGAGARVFRSAQADRLGFALTVAAQAFLSRRAPRLLQRLLFAGADHADTALANSPKGRVDLSRILANAWTGNGAGYRRDLLTYVEPWSDELGAITAPVSLWHGTADIWAPIAMARSLTQHLPSARLFEGAAGHYTTLLDSASAALAAIEN